MDPDFVERRRIGLENFLLRVASHPILCRDKIFYLFLTQVFSFIYWSLKKIHLIFFLLHCRMLMLKYPFAAALLVNMRLIMFFSLFLFLKL